jgi:hypothetical protein
MTSAKLSSNTSVEEEYNPEPTLELKEITKNPTPRITGFFDFRDHHGFEKPINVDGVNHLSKVFVSAAELTIEVGVVKPFQGAASIEIHTVVPREGRIIVRGFIGWDTDIPVRLHVFVA